MTRDNIPARQTVQALRQEFDAAFALPPRTSTETLEGFLAIRLEAVPYAIRVANISGLHVDRRIESLPTPVTPLLGLTGFRGQVAPVYDLASLCGSPRPLSPRWMVVLRAHELIALAFETFELHFLAAPHQMVSIEDTALATSQITRLHLQGAVRHDDVVRPIIQLQSLLTDIRQRASAYNPTRSLPS